MMRRLFLSLQGLLGCSSYCSGATCADADLVVKEGQIITMDTGRRTARAMAMRDGKILAIGTDQKIRDCIGPRTQAIDLKGHTVLPGLIDVHTHALKWAKSIVAARKSTDAIHGSVPLLISFAWCASAPGLRRRANG